MLRLKVEKFITQKRKFYREQQFFITRQLYFKKIENIQCFQFLEDLDQVSFQQVQQYYQKLSENSFEILKQGFISKFSILFSTNYNQIIKHFNILIPVLALLCKQSENIQIQQEQLQAFPFFLEVIKLQDVELIDLAIDGLTNLSKYKLVQNYSQEFINDLLDLINLQDSNINIAQTCALISKQIEIKLSNNILNLLFTSRFRASILYYLNIDCCTILKFLLKLLEKHLDLGFIVDNEFIQAIVRQWDSTNYERIIYVFYFMKHFLSSNSNASQYIDYGPLILKAQKMKQEENSFDFLIDQFLKLSKPQITLKQKPFEILYEI
ncbi:unnamed protein product [Paramecium sonneborni]|uniref:Uncharacterized protein n=1 Tax=Paramecium sonneborni TaxID=65129 RepID=A0A8S1LDT6_9CILI|nr:unnamed protein product [Paramecium sonneborni]